MKFWLILLAFLFTFSTTDAKYKYPEGAKTMTERKVDRRMKRYSSDNEKGLSLEEYEKFREVRTVDERRQEHRAKKKGYYISPEEEFKLIDLDGDGVISQSEMLQYERSKINQ